MAKINKTIALLYLIILIAPLRLDATTYYVDKDHPNASDNNPGTENLPWKSIEKAVNTAIAGDTVIFKKASTDYMVNSNLSFPHSGTPENYIIFKAYSVNEKPVWNWGGNNFRIQDKHYITIDGFVIKNMSDGLYTRTGSSHIHIINNHIIGLGNGSDGELVRITGVNCLISHNEIEKAGHNAVYLTSSSEYNITPNNTIIEYNYIHDNSYHHGINIFPVTSDNNPLHIDSIIIRYNRIETSDWGIYTRYMRAFKIYNNIIYNNQYGGIHLGGFDSDNGGAPNRNEPYDGLGAIVANNIIVSALSNDDTGFENARVNNMIFVNNIVSAGFLDEVSYYNRDGGAHPVLNQTIDYNIYDGGEVLWNSSTYGSPSDWFFEVPEHNNNSFDTDPLYVTTGFDQRWNVAGTFELQPGSPAIDAGYSLNQYGIYDDYIHVSRPQGNNWDIGAFETLSGPDVYPPKLIEAALLDSITLSLLFSEPLDPSSTLDVNNYSISNGINVLSVVPSGSIVTLNTTVHTPGIYNITVNNVTDLAGNLISQDQNSAEYEMPEDPNKGMVMLDVVNVTASVIPEPEHSPEKTIDGLGYGDGDPDSRWAGDTMPEWIMFDLGTAKTVGMTKLSFYHWNSGRIYNYSIEVSTDMNQWTEVVIDAFSSLEEWIIDEFNPLQARYIKVIFLNSNETSWAGLWEGEIWGHEVTSIENEEYFPNGFKLEQNFPNPFNPSTTIKFDIQTDQNIKLSVYNSLGELISILADGVYSAGSHNIIFNAQDLTSGIYLYKLQTKQSYEVKKMMLLK